MKKGFASAGMIYTLLVLFLILTFTLLNTMQNKKTVLDNLKEETVNALYCNQNTINELKNQIKELQSQLAKKNNEIANLKNVGDASSSQILSGKKALVKGKEITGTMNNINGNTSAKSVIVASDLTKFQINTPGYYDTNDYLYVNNSTLASKIGLTASKLAKGKTVLGVSGTYTSDATASASNILSGKTAYVNGSKVTGTMTDYGYEPQAKRVGEWRGSVYLYVPDVDTGTNGATSGQESGKITRSIKTPLYSFGNATSNKVLSGQTFTSQSGLKITGTMADRGLAQYGSWGCGSNGCGSGNDAYYAINSLPEGYYHSDGNSWAPEARINANTLRAQLGVSANKIIQGQSIAGVSGTANCSGNPSISGGGGISYRNDMSLSYTISTNSSGKQVITVSAHSAWGFDADATKVVITLN